MDEIFIIYSAVAIPNLLCVLFSCRARFGITISSEHAVLKMFPYGILTFFSWIPYHNA